MNCWEFAFNNVRRNACTYAAYFLSCTFAVMIFFTYARFIFRDHAHMITIIVVTPMSCSAMGIVRALDHVVKKTTQPSSRMSCLFSDDNRL